MADLDLRDRPLLWRFNNWAKPVDRFVRDNGRPDRLLVSAKQFEEFTKMCDRWGRSTDTFKGFPVVVVADEATGG